MGFVLPRTNHCSATPPHAHSRVLPSILYHMLLTPASPSPWGEPHDCSPHDGGEVRYLLGAPTVRTGRELVARIGPSEAGWAFHKVRSPHQCFSPIAPPGYNHPSKMPRKNPTMITVIATDVSSAPVITTVPLPILQMKTPSRGRTLPEKASE